MTDWNPALYARFEDERTRPARELLARVTAEVPASVVDLGCGPGNSTELLAARYPRAAAIVGVDNSPAMLAAARRRLPAALHPGVHFETGDIKDWQPQRPVDLIFANAALQWVGDHAALLPRLFAALAPGGTLAVQMPDNLEEPSHRLMREIAARAPWSALTGDAAAVRERLLAADAYYDLLAADAAEVDVWRTAYHHPMASPQAIVDWLRATGLKPFVECLDAPLAASYLAAYRDAVDAAYPRRTDGSRLLAFPRLFIVARRRP